MENLGERRARGQLVSPTYSECGTLNNTSHPELPRNRLRQRRLPRPERALEREYGRAAWRRGQNSRNYFTRQLHHLLGFRNPNLATHTPTLPRHPTKEKPPGDLVARGAIGLTGTGSFTPSSARPARRAGPGTSPEASPARAQAPRRSSPPPSRPCRPRAALQGTGTPAPERDRTCHRVAARRGTWLRRPFSRRWRSRQRRACRTPRPSRRPAGGAPLLARSTP